MLLACVLLNAWISVSPMRLLPFWRTSGSSSEEGSAHNGPVSTHSQCLALSEHGNTVHTNTTKLFSTLQDWLEAQQPYVEATQSLMTLIEAQLHISSTIPSAHIHADPLSYIASELEGISFKYIPPVIHMTIKDKSKLSAHNYVSILSWIKFNPEWVILLYDDSDVVEYVRKYHPEFLHTLLQLQTPVERADAWRYLLLCTHGGLYTDMDTVCAQPISSWIHTPGVSPGLVVGVENAFNSLEEAHKYNYVRRVQMLQWTFAAKPKHPLVCHLPSRIEEHMAKEKQGLVKYQGPDEAVLLRTGPGMWSGAIEELLSRNELTPEDILAGKVVEDVLFLPQTAFGCSWRFWSVDNKNSLVYHMYNHSWNTEKGKLAKALRRQQQADIYNVVYSNWWWYLLFLVLAVLLMRQLTLCLVQRGLRARPKSTKSKE